MADVRREALNGIHKLEMDADMRAEYATRASNLDAEVSFP